MESFHWPEFNFTEWMTLNEEDPEAFEQRRLKWINQTIEAAPEDYQQRLRGLMFQVDMKRKQAKNPLQACILISQMMWQSTADLKVFLEDLGCLMHNPELLENRRKIQSAEILAFPQN
nr:DUF3135 domain-containing protein [Aliikangiella sp. G2MR2-5]